MFQFFKMQLFRAALPGDLWKAVTQHNQNTITLDDMYQVDTDTQRESGTKAIWPVIAFQNRWINQFQNKPRKQNQGAPQRGNRFNSGAGNNTNRNGKYCFYCKIQNHTQEECRKRIRKNKPCKDKQGCAYWPKVYVTSNGDSEQQDRDQQGQQLVLP
jgi:hypothetical protein